MPFEKPHSANQMPAPALSRGMTFIMAAACGAVAANLYYAQPLIALISPDVGLSTAAGGLPVTLTQIGYGIGLLLVVPAGDLVENRRLLTATLCATALLLVIAGSAPWASLFLIASLFIGIMAVGAQILVPMAAHMAEEERRGAVVGNVMSGLLVGILLARPISSLIADSFGWRAVFYFSAAVMTMMALALSRILPRRVPAGGFSYVTLLASLLHLVRDTPVLRRKALYHMAFFANFSMFWTAVPLQLASPAFGFTQKGIAMFALAGAAGAIFAPFAGRFADRGWSKAVTATSMALAVVAFPLAYLGGTYGSLPTLLAAALLLDIGVTGNLIVGQRAINQLGNEHRSRLNGLYVAAFYFGGAMGSAVAAFAFSHEGWGGVSAIGLTVAIVAILYFAFEVWRGREG